MTTCKTCGAGTKSELMLCEYCGASIREELSAADELEAVKELARTAQRLSQRSMTMAERIKNEGLDNMSVLWKTAYIPKTFEAQLQVFQQVTGLMDTGTAKSQNMMKAGAASAKNKALLEQADRILAAMREHHGNDPECTRRLKKASDQIQRIHDENKAATKAKLMQVGITFAVVFGLGGLFIFSIANRDVEEYEIALDPDECRYASQTCDEDCRKKACEALCEEGDSPWACVGVDALAQGTKKKTKKTGNEIPEVEPEIDEVESPTNGKRSRSQKAAGKSARPQYEKGAESPATTGAPSKMDWEEKPSRAEPEKGWDEPPSFEDTAAP